MKTTTYYSKPQKVFAIQYEGGSDFMDALKEHYHWAEITWEYKTPR
jgi:hypothetical protein